MVTPRWSNISSVKAYISNSGKTIYLEAYIKAENTASKITGTMYLEKKSGSSWVQVKSWSISGTGNAAPSQSYAGIAGIEYRTRVVATVNGECAEAFSDSCTV